jgi:hypothetical protein
VRHDAFVLYGVLLGERRVRWWMVLIEGKINR